MLVRTVADSKVLFISFYIKPNIIYIIARYFKDMIIELNLGLKTSPF